MTFVLSALLLATVPSTPSRFSATSVVEKSPDGKAFLAAASGTITSCLRLRCRHRAAHRDRQPAAALCVRHRRLRVVAGGHRPRRHPRHHGGAPQLVPYSARAVADCWTRSSMRCPCSFLPPPHRRPPASSPRSCGARAVCWSARPPSRGCSARCHRRCPVGCSGRPSPSSSWEPPRVR